MLTSHYVGFNMFKRIISGMFIVKYLGGLILPILMSVLRDNNP
jgi:hypothetical protein